MQRYCRGPTLFVAALLIAAVALAFPIDHAAAGTPAQGFVATLELSAGTAPPPLAVDLAPMHFALEADASALNVPAPIVASSDVATHWLLASDPVAFAPGRRSGIPALAGHRQPIVAPHDLSHSVEAYTRSSLRPSELHPLRC